MDSNKKGAGSRRSAVAERLRLRAEWAALKGADSTNDALRGLVVLVEVGSGTKALALRAALSALGATVVSTWLPLVTHVVWGTGGCRKIRAKARALACSLVSPLWVEACAAAARRLPERAFPSATRPSDLPSPQELRRLLKIADKENLPLNFLQGTQDPTPSQRSQKSQVKRLQVSASSTESSREGSSDESPDVRSRVNTAPRRPNPTSPVMEKKSRRKLFSHKEVDGDEASSDDGTPEGRPVPPGRAPKVKPGQAKVKPGRVKVTPQNRRDLARAERMARRLARATPAPTQPSLPGSDRPRIVLTGMSGIERKTLHDAVHKLNGRIQSKVTKKTTHVILGSCSAPDTTNIILTARKQLQSIPDDITGIETLGSQSIFNATGRRNVLTGQITGNVRSGVPSKPRTLNALEGAARGCRVLRSEWVLDSAKAGKWLHHYSYEVPHLRKLSQRARVERSAICRLRSEYAYDVFCGLHTRITDDTEQKEAAKTLLLLCGAKIVDTENADITLGAGNGHVGSKWVFDSVASARVRSTRRYVVGKNVVQTIESQNSDGIFTLDGR